MGLVRCIRCSLPSSFLDECVGCYCTSIRCDWIARKFVDVVSKDVTSSLFFFAKTLIVITPSGCKLFQHEFRRSHKVVAITNSGVP
jgi:hypothetical protein